MTIQISDELHEALYGDEAVLKYLEIMRKAFIEGNKSAVFYVLPICARYQAVIPEWAADEILKIESNLYTGKLKDFNDALGWEGEHQATRKKEARLRNLSNQVIISLQEHRLKGASLNADDILQTVAEELKISRRDVEDIYKQSGQFTKDLPRKKPENTAYAIMHTTLPSYRRHGRPVLKD